LAQVRTDAPANWGIPGRARVAVEVDEERLADRSRFTYAVRYVVDDTERGWAGLVRLVVGAPAGSGTGRLTTAPIALESPPGWEARVFPDDPARPTSWHVPGARPTWPALPTSSSSTNGATRPWASAEGRFAPVARAARLAARLCPSRERW
jgi:hypothetical protein